MKLKRAFLVLAAVVTIGVAGIASYSVMAQGVTRTDISDFIMCSNTDYTSVAAQAIGINPTDLRVGLTSGRTLAELSNTKTSSLAKVYAALNAAYLVDIDLALKNGLITQTQADSLKAALNNGQLVQRPTPARTRNFQNNPPPADVPPSTLFARGGLPIGVSALNTIRPEAVAAKSLVMSCPELVKAQRAGKSIADIAAEKLMPLQRPLDAVVNAYKKALSQDVKERLLTMPQADARSANLLTSVGALMNTRGSAGLLR